MHRRSVKKAFPTLMATDMKSNWIRRTALAFGALVVLLIAAAVYLIATFDADSYKAKAVEWMKTERQRNLAIDGPIKLSVFPKLAVKVSGVRLSERGKKDQFATIDEASLSVQALPLLSKKLIVDSVSARGVFVNYRRDAKGVRNFDDLLPAADRDKSVPADEGDATSPLILDVSSVSFDDLQLQLDDEMAGIEALVVLQSFKSGRLANRIETPVSLKASIDMKKPQAMALSIDGSANVTPDLDSGEVALSAAKLAIAGDAAGVKGLAASLDGALGWAGGELRAGPLKVSVSSATMGTTSVSPSSLQVKRLVFNTEAQKLELEELEAALAGKLAKDAFELSLKWPKLAVEADKLQGSALSGAYKLAGATSLAGSFATAAPSGNFDALKLPGLNVKLEGTSGKRSVDGTLKADVLLQITKKEVALDNLILNADLSEPSLQPLKLALEGRIEAAAAAAQWDLEGSLNANRFESNGRASLAGEVPDITAKARFDSLDLNKLLAADEAEASQSAKTPAPAETPVELDSLRAVNGKFSFSAGKFIFRHYQLADTRIEATLRDGKLDISRLAGRTWGGKIDASGSASAASGQVAVKLDAQDVDINSLLRDVADKDLLEGKGRVLADVTTQGESVGAMRSNLAGSASFRLRDGAIKGINLARSFRQAKAALTMKQDAVNKADKSEKTDFSELNASALISGGVARSDDLELKSPFLRLGGEGSFDIGRGRISYTARTTVIASATGQDGAELSALRGVTIPVLLSGPFEAIDWKIQWSEVAAAALKNSVKDKLSEKLGARLGLGAAKPADDGASAAAPAKPKDVLKDKLLKGLFK